MRPIVLIVSRELAAYFKGITGYVIFALLLLAAGLFFYGVALGGPERMSAEVLTNFFYITSGCTMFAAILVSMRLFAEESRDETMVLLTTAPISDWHVAVGKWLSAFLFVTVFLALTFYMPLMVAVNGTVSVGHILAGYLGLVLIAAATTAIGTFASSLTRSQVVAGIAGAAITIVLLLLWKLAKVSDPPFDDLFSYLAFYDKHFMPFMKGRIHVRDVLYYVSITFFALLLTRHMLGARRWR